MVRMQCVYVFVFFLLVVVVLLLLLVLVVVVLLFSCFFFLLLLLVSVVAAAAALRLLVFNWFVCELKMLTFYCHLRVQEGRVLQSLRNGMLTHDELAPHVGAVLASLCGSPHNFADLIEHNLPMQLGEGSEFLQFVAVLIVRSSSASLSLPLLYASVCLGCLSSASFLCACLSLCLSLFCACLFLCLSCVLLHRIIT